MKFPIHLPPRGRTLVTIYGKNEAHDFYRLYCWQLRLPDGKPWSRIKDFPTYALAKAASDKLVSDLSEGSPDNHFEPGAGR